MCFATRSKIGEICAVGDETALSIAGVVENGELHMQGDFYDVKLFEVVDG